MSDIWQALQALIVELKPAIESLFIGILTAAVTGGLSYLTDNTGTFTVQSLIAGMLAGVLDYLTSKARHEDAKQVKAEADAKVASVQAPPNTNF